MDLIALNEHMISSHIHHRLCDIANIAESTYYCIVMEVFLISQKRYDPDTKSINKNMYHYLIIIVNTLMLG